MPWTVSLNIYHIYLAHTLVPATIGAFLMGLLTSVSLRLHVFISVTEETLVQRHIDKNNYKVYSATSYFSLCFSCFPANILLTWVCRLSGLLKLFKSKKKEKEALQWNSDTPTLGA